MKNIKAIGTNSFILGEGKDGIYSDLNIEVRTPLVRDCIVNQKLAFTNVWFFIVVSNG